MQNVAFYAHLQHSGFTMSDIFRPKHFSILFRVKHQLYTETISFQLFGYGRHLTLSGTSMDFAFGALQNIPANYESFPFYLVH